MSGDTSVAKQNFHLDHDIVIHLAFVVMKAFLFCSCQMNIVNNMFLIGMSYFVGKIPQNKCPLFIAGRGPGYDRTEDFYGYMDNVSTIFCMYFHLHLLHKTK